MLNILAEMKLANIDWAIIGAFFVVSLGIGLWASKSAGKSSKEFFLGGRSMPWWLLGVSMVATTFSTDTPNVVANFVRSDGVAKNWAWWAFLLSGMLTVFVFAKLWRRSEVMTDVEFYEVRFSGKSAAFLRGFRAIYLGLGFNVVIMGAVSLAAIKFGEIVLGVPGWQTLLIAGTVTLVYSSLGGLKGVIWTDFIQFILAMVGSVWAMFHILNLDAVGGIDLLMQHPNLVGKTSLFPDFNNPEAYVPLLLVPIAVTWWASYYPGAEPGGGGYIVQRMLSAKDEKNAIGATFFFNVAHYALRPWPWILIALASLVLVPMKIDSDYDKGKHLRPDAQSIERIDNNIDSSSYATMLSQMEQIHADALADKDAAKNKDAIAEQQRLITICRDNPASTEVKALTYIWQEKSKDSDTGKLKEAAKRANPYKSEQLVHMFLVNPNISLDKLGQDAGYPTMLKLLPPGLIGLVAASLIAAFMSTMSTQVNLGASYIVNDFYARFINPEASEKQLVNGGRIATFAMLVLGSVVGLNLTDAYQAFKMILLIGAGTGPVYILRWFWWRINANSEIAAMAASLTFSVITQLILPKTHPAMMESIPSWQILLAGTAFTTITWLLITFLTRPSDDERLFSFYKKVQPGGPGWETIRKRARAADQDIESGQGWDVPQGILCTVLGSIGVYTALFAAGAFIYSETTSGAIYSVISVASFIVVINIWKKLKTQ